MHLSMNKNHVAFKFKSNGINKKLADFTFLTIEALVPLCASELKTLSFAVKCRVVITPHSLGSIFSEIQALNYLKRTRSLLFLALLASAKCYGQVRSGDLH